MPSFDKKCLSCDWETDFALEPSYDCRPCPKCGGKTERLWLKTPQMVPDTFATPLVDDVMLKTTQTFYSRSERRAAMKKHGYQEMIRHAGEVGSDKSKHTISWMSGPPAGHDPRQFAHLSPEEQEARRIEWAAR